MGINKPDVRYVIHHTIPQSVTHYYQVCALEIPMRDCKGAECSCCAMTGSWTSRKRWRSGKLHPLLFLSGLGTSITIPNAARIEQHTNYGSIFDVYVKTRRRKLITKDRDNMQHRNVHLQNLRRMTEFCENQVECRRTSLLEYFGEHFSSDQCRGTCDNCKNKALGITFEKSDVTEDCVALAGMSKYRMISWCDLATKGRVLTVACCL